MALKTQSRCPKDWRERTGVQEGTETVSFGVCEGGGSQDSNRIAHITDLIRYRPSEFGSLTGKPRLGVGPAAATCSATHQPIGASQSNTHWKKFARRHEVRTSTACDKEVTISTFAVPKVNYYGTLLDIKDH